MPRKTAEQAIQLIENERAIIRILRSDPSDYSDLLFELKQFADPENVRPLRPLEPNADRNQVYDYKLKTFVHRELKRKERGLPQPGNLRIKAVSGTLSPQDGNMRFYNHANSNQDHKHVIYGVDAGENPDRYLYLHKKDPTIEVKDEPCLIAACFASDAGTNTKWHIKGQPLNTYHYGRYPEAISFEQLRENNREFVKNRTDDSRHKDERNEVKFKPSVGALHFIGAVSDDLEDLMNALHFKLLVWQHLKIHLPVLVFNDEGKRLYPEEEQVPDILSAFSRGVSFAFDIHDQVIKGAYPANSIFSKYHAMFVDYREYVKHMRLLDSDETIARFLVFHDAKISQSLNHGEDKALTETDLTRTDDYKNAVAGRKLWGEMVSETYQYETTHPQDTSAVLTKLKNAGLQGDLKEIYQKMCVYLQQKTKIVLAFKAEDVIQQMPVSLAYLNLSEIDALKLQEERKSHLDERNKVENVTFAYLDKIEERFEKTMQARPRYAYLTFCDEFNYPMPLTKSFGFSYFMLRDVIKFNSLFVPENVIQNFEHRADPIRPCTYFNFDVLLDQASTELLLGVAHAVTGKLPKYQIRNNDQFEMHAYIPSIELFDPNVVERLYVSPDEYKMSETEIDFLQRNGIKVVNVGTHIYAEEEIQLEAAARTDDVDAMQNLLKLNPFLRHNYGQALEHGDVALYHYLLRHDPESKRLSWQELLERVPVDKVELFHAEWTSAELSTITEHDLVTLMTFKDKVLASNSIEAFQLLLRWIHQFNAADIKLRYVREVENRQEPDLLLGTFISHAILHDLVYTDTGQTSKVIDLIQSGLVTPERIQAIAHALFKNPNAKLAADYVIEKQYYQLTHDVDEQEAFLAGGHYVYIADNPQMAARIDWHSSTSFDLVKELLNKVDNVVFLEKAFLNMQAASAFERLSFDFKLHLLQFVVEKNPASLFVFTAALFGPGLQVSNPELDRMVHTLGQSSLCRSYRAFFAINFKIVKPTKEEKTNASESALPLTVSDWQGEFFNDLSSHPHKLRDAKYIAMLCANLPSFGFFYEENPVRYSLACVQFYFPELVAAWRAKPYLLSLAQLRELIVFYIRKGEHYIHEVKKLIHLQPELIHTQVPGSGDSLLHLVLKENWNDDDLIQQLIGSKAAHVNNVAGLSTLSRLIQMQDETGVLSANDFDTLVTEFLQRIPYSNEQLIYVLNEMNQITQEDLVGHSSRQICAVLNKRGAHEDALKASFLSAITTRENKPAFASLWKSYLQIKSMPPSAFQEAIVCMVRASFVAFTKQEIHDVLNCLGEFDYGTIPDSVELKVNYRLYFCSHVLSHPHCVVKSAEVAQYLVTEFNELLTMETIPKAYHAEIVVNYRVMVDRLKQASEEKVMPREAQVSGSATLPPGLFSRPKNEVLRDAQSAPVDERFLI